MAKRKRAKTGLPPGTLVFTGKKHVEQPNISLLQYDADTIIDQEQKDRMAPLKEGPAKHWYDIRGLHNTELIREFGEKYNIHPLAQEDILDTQQRPKMEEYENGVFITVQALTMEEDLNKIDTEQIALFFGKDFLLSFQEKEDDNFASVRNRLLVASGKIRRRGTDYLAYALLDTIVDYYYPILDHIDDQINAVEASILKEPTQEDKSTIHQLKRQLLTLRKAIVPLREAVNRFSRLDNPLVSDDTLIFVRDLYDHVYQIIDTIETYRDLLNGLYDLYLSEFSYRTNNVMQVLTIISTVFIPLTFLAGIYGMNFKNMPELEWRYGYFGLWGVMLLTVAASLLYFRRKKWI
jgi:magnesium transporter